MSSTPDPHLHDLQHAGLPAGSTAAVKAMMRAEHTPGLSVAVTDRDRLRYAAGFGVADPVTGAPATARSAYPWFSMSKPVTATAALRLADEGRLDLDQPIGDYLEDVTEPGVNQPTVRDLLGHTAGFANPIPIRWAHHVEVARP